MRKKVIAGNWKMNKDLSGSINLISELKTKLADFSGDTQIIICPPFTSLETAKTLLDGTKIRLGAQNMHYETSGAFTGELSPGMLKSVGCEFVILGHSERRTLFGETNSVANKKLKTAVSSGLLPIFCIGETLNERETNLTFKIIEKQIREGLKDIDADQFDTIIIAYEPVWAIGTGKTATPEQAQEVHKFIRDLISDIYSPTASQKLTIQYGGSVKPENAATLLGQPDIDGALVGGACLDSSSFVSIIEAC